MNAAPMGEEVRSYPLEKLSWLFVNEIEGGMLSNETDPDKYDMNKMLMGEKIEDISQYNPKVGWNLKDGNEYYYLGFGDSTVSDSLKRRMEEQLGVRDIEFSYIVGADDIEDIEVYLVDGVEVDGYYFYTYEDILNQYLKSKNG